MRNTDCCALILLFCLAGSANAELVLIVNSKNSENFSRIFIANLYLGKIKTFPSGAKVTALAMPSGTVAHSEFLKKVLNRSEANLSSYWARMLFSSKGQPPYVVRSAAEAVMRVEQDVSAIAYVFRDDIGGADVRIVKTFP